MSVAEFNRAAADALRDHFRRALWIEGEVSQAKLYPSGHLYFELKDDREDARLACVMWKSNASRANARIAVGERVELFGRPSIYGPSGRFQFVADAARAAGSGLAAARLEALKAKLLAEGLFDPARKRPLPAYPRGIGVVTSAAGAAVQDILKEISRRWPVRVVLAPAQVQGPEAPRQIARAIARLSRIAGIDVVIVGRGGGAAEDLAAFNDEGVARAIAACRVPVVSAVGHQVDHTLADLVADVRAATPTAAATLCTPVLDQELERVAVLRARLRRAMDAKVQRLALELERVRLRDPRPAVAARRQTLDALVERAEAVLHRRIAAGRRDLAQREVSLASRHPRARLAADRATLDRLDARLVPAMRGALEAPRRTFAATRESLERAVRAAVQARKESAAMQVAKLEALSPLRILARGYGVVLHEGHALVDATLVPAGANIEIRLHRGALEATVVRTRP